MSVKRLALTAGEPAGIGPDLCVQLAQQKQQAQIIVIADPLLLRQRAEQLGLEIDLIEVDFSEPAYCADAGQLFYLPVPLHEKVVAGELNKANSGYVLDTLQTALDGCLESYFSAVVTAPVQKSIINDAGISFSGHTEFFADGAGIDKVVMMLATDDLRVALTTTHLPLIDVAGAITQEALQRVLTITVSSLQDQFAIPQPRVAVCGLNPHAGEGGHLGREEIEVIQPIIDKMQAQGLNISGAWPADTIFNQDKLKDYDAVLAMYHDQGLPVLKHHGFGKAVNVTLGLPFIRTSVDHGTALDLAGTGQAKATSLQAAIDMAIKMAQSQDKL
jgi:4-hydroxythreonine-4-phosphate dehydrogenase